MTAIAALARRLDAVHRRLAGAGYRLVPPDEAWPMFRRARSTYADRLDAMATYWAVPPAAWFGGRRSIHAHGQESRVTPVVAPSVEREREVP